MPLRLRENFRHDGGNVGIAMVFIFSEDEPVRQNFFGNRLHLINGHRIFTINHGHGLRGAK